MNTEPLCDHCDEEPSQPNYTEHLCKACRLYRDRKGHLPDDDVLSRRYGWPVQGNKAFSKGGAK